MDIKERLKELGIKFTPAGDDIVILCPFHDDRVPSLSIFIIKGNKKYGIWNCFSCDASGNWEEFEEQYDELQLKVSVKSTKKKSGKRKIKRLREEIMDEFKPIKGVAETFLRERGITNYKDFELKYCPMNYKRWAWRGRIIIPIYDLEGKLLTIRCRRIIKPIKEKTKMISFKGIHLNTFFGANKLKDKERVVVVEGEFDAMYLQQFGIPAIAILGVGRQRFTSEQTAFLYKFKNVYLSYDGDSAGRTAQNRIHRYLLLEYVHVEQIKLPIDKDPNDLSVKEVKKIYKKAIFSVDGE